MRIGLIERTMFAVMASACIKELRKEHAEWDGRAIRGEARRRFKRMLRETPSIGSYRSNCWKMNLVGGAVWFSLYEADLVGWSAGVGGLAHPRTSSSTFTSASTTL